MAYSVDPQFDLHMMYTSEVGQIEFGPGISTKFGLRKMHFITPVLSNK